MIIADYIAIGLILLSGSAGALVGFGKGLKTLTKGVPGVILSVLTCISILGMVYNLNFVRFLMDRIVDALSSAESGFCRFLVTIQIDKIAIAVALFALIQIGRRLIVALLSRALESESAVCRAINSSLGAVLSISVFIGGALLILTVLYYSAGAQAPGYLQGSFFKLDELFLNNPFVRMIQGR